MIQTTEGLFNELLNETRRFYELKYRNPKTEKIDDGYVAEIEKIIADLQNKYRQSV